MIHVETVIGKLSAQICQTAERATDSAFTQVTFT